MSKSEAEHRSRRPILVEQLDIWKVASWAIVQRSWPWVTTGVIYGKKRTILPNWLIIK